MCKLTIELVPETSWFTNVRSIVSSVEWDNIRKKCYKDAGYKCEICNGQGSKWPVECHEIWEYNDTDHTQILTGLISLCPDCHRCKHPGLARIHGKLDLVISHLMKINFPDIDPTDNSYAHNMVDEAFVLWRNRSSHQWKLDVSYLDDYLPKEPLKSTKLKNN